jgi:hypothetical protein
MRARSNVASWATQKTPSAPNDIGALLLVSKTPRGLAAEQRLRDGATREGAPACVDGSANAQHAEKTSPSVAGHASIPALSTKTEAAADGSTNRGTPRGDRRAPKPKVVHMAKMVSSKGEVSPLCANRPRALDLKPVGPRAAQRRRQAARRVRQGREALTSRAARAGWAWPCTSGARDWDSGHGAAVRR